MISNKSRISVNSMIVATKDQVSSDLGDETAILSLRNGVYYSLNPVGARVWQLLQMPIPVKEIRDTILEEYDVSSEQCERDILVLLEKLFTENLVESLDETNS